MIPFLNIVAPENNPDKMMGLNPSDGKSSPEDTGPSGIFLDILGLSLAGKISPELVPFETNLTDLQMPETLSPIIMGSVEPVSINPELTEGVLPEILGSMSMLMTGDKSDNPIEVATKSVITLENISGILKNSSGPVVIIESPSLISETNVEKSPNLADVIGPKASTSIEAALIPETVTNQTEVSAKNQNTIVFRPDTNPAYLTKEMSSSALWDNLASALNIRQMRITTPEATPLPVSQVPVISQNESAVPGAIIEENEIAKPAAIMSEPATAISNNTEEESVQLTEDTLPQENKFDLSDDSPEPDITSRLTENSGKSSGAMRQTGEILTSGTETASRPEAASPVRETTPPMRFVLPENLKGHTSEQGRTVMIKMEPENLGSIRMTMSSVHDTITARLVVDTAMARTAVEANLNQLLEQLDRQGIKVDFFEVSVGGSLVGDNAKEHAAPSNLRHSGRFVRDFEKIWSGDDKLSSSLRLNYVGATGVNCLA